MQLIKKCEKFGNVLFYAAILIHIAVMCEGYSEWERLPSGRLLQVAFGLCVVKIITTYYEKWEWIAMAAMGIIATLSYCISAEKYMIYLVVLVFAAKSVDAKMVTLLTFDGVWISSIVIAIFSITGIGGKVKIVQDFGRGMVETRYCLGFSHPNNLHGTLWYILCLWIILYKNRNDWRHYSVATIINVVLFFFTKSRTGVIVSELIIIAGIVYTYWDEQIFEKKLTYCLGYVVLGFTVFLTVIGVSVNPENYGQVLAWINKLTTGRLGFAYEVACIDNWHAFLSGTTESKVALDNGFAVVPARFGYVVAIVFVAFFVWAIYKSSKEKKGVVWSAVLTCILYTFMESSYTVNDMYLLSNIVVVAAFGFFGVWGDASEKPNKETEVNVLEMSKDEQ